jgi:hypothetical protein
MSFAMLLETTLLIIRSNRPEPLEDRMPHLTDPHRLRGASRPAAEGAAAEGAQAGAGRSSEAEQQRRKSRAEKKGD